MPPQETNLTSGTGRNAAGLRLDLAVASVKGTTGDASAEARPEASIPTLRDAFPEKEPAGRLAASVRSILSSLGSYLRVFQERRKRERLRVSLHHLTERQLMDIGLTRSDIDHIVAHRAIERLRDGHTYRWLSRGLM
jgi:uncharacterized protein YjiS (DUF1127 family)